MKKQIITGDEKKERKIPFKVLSKKGLMGFMLAGVVAVGPLMFTGCADGKDGNDGKDANVWKAGTNYEEFTDAKVGDFFIDTDDYILYQKSENSWVAVMENYGKPGAQGEQGTSGQPGTPGQNGTSLYVGYDGYVWQDGTRTKHQLAEVVGVDGVVENTLELKGNKFFTEGLVDTTTNQVALMSNYYQYTGKVGYSGTKVTNISVYADVAGKLTIGTASLTDVKTARESGENVDVNNSTTVDVVAGLNNISLELSVGTYETVVIGGGETTVKLAKTSGVDVDDEHGLYSLIGDTSNAGTFATTNGVKDKLIINTVIETSKYVELDEGYKERYADASKFNAITAINGSSPWFQDKCSGEDNPYENVTITRIDLPIGKVNAVDNNQKIQVGILDKSSLVAEQTATLKREITLNIPYEEIKNAQADGTLNKWVSITGLNIVMAEGETLGIGGKLAENNTVSIMFSGAGTAGTWASRCSGGGTAKVAHENYEMFYTAYKSEETTVSDHLKTLKDAEDLEVKKLEILSGKKVSILGDSISTYQGYSNDAANTNSTIGGNAVWYGSVGNLKVEETWWMQTLNDLNMELCVNNSASGSQVWEDTNKAGYNTRVENLHDNTGTTVNPDIILVYMGINDILNDTEHTSNLGTYEAINFDTLITDNGDDTYTYATPTTFAEAYAITIHKAINIYGADVFCFTPQNAVSAEQKPYLATMVDIIKKVANHFETGLVDLYSETSLTAVHPDAVGMDKVTELVEQAIINKLVK